MVVLFLIIKRSVMKTAFDIIWFVFYKMTAIFIHNFKHLKSLSL